MYIDMLTFLELGNYGRFGNQLWQVASTIGIAIKNDKSYIFPKWVHPFGRNTDHLYEDNPHLNSLITDLNYERYDVPWGYHDIKLPSSNKGNVVKTGWFGLHGYLQSEKYFKHCEYLIRGLFLFKEPTDAPWGEFIAVHVRRGDYDPQYHTLLGLDYYTKALALLPDLPVIVFTDAEIAEAASVVPRYDYILGKGSDTFKSLQYMTMAAHHVIANSSFSWWGAWLADAGQVIAPKDWFGPLQKISPKDIYTDKIIVI